MLEEKFKIILLDEEKIEFVESVNKKAFTVKKTFSYFLFFIIAGVFIAQISTIATVAATEGKIGIMVWPMTFLIVLCIGMIISIILAILNSNNTYFCITNQRIIKRHGAFNNKFIHYSLKNIGTIEVSGGMFDSRGEKGSANIIVVTKDFHTDSKGNVHQTRFRVESLNNAYEAYKILNKLTQGNNEALRIKNIK